MRATDAVGNLGNFGSAGANIAVRVDTMAPVVTTDALPNAVKPTKNANNQSLAVRQ